MTDPVVGVLVQELFKSFQAQTNVIEHFKDEFDKLLKSLTPMKSFLIDVRQLRKNSDKEYETVKTSLNDLRDLIYDADDILLDCQIRADYRREVSKMPCTFTPRELLFRYQTGRRLKEINMQIRGMENILKTYCAPFVGQKINRDDSYTNPRFTTHFCNQSDIVGLTENTEKIKRWILQKNEELQRVGIVGMGGLGKTTITQKIFNHREIIEHFDERIWVSVSETVNLVKIMKSMLEQLHQDDSGTEDNLLRKIQQALTNKKYLIVMDDVWSIENGWWAQIINGLPNDKKHNCSIIITTRNEEVAHNMGVMEGRIHRPKTLNKEDSWLLLCKAAFPKTKGICPKPELENVGKKIVQKCDGLPLAIKTIGGLLSAKPQSRTEWQKIDEEFYDKLAENINNNSVITSLQLSYDALPAHLKQCILCFCIYPEDSHISAEHLVRWWVGEGFVQGKDKKTATQVAFDSLTELFSRCLVEVVDHRGYDGRVYNCKMHDMVRELIIKMAKEEAFCTFDDGNKQIFNSNSRHLGFTSEMSEQPLQMNSKLRALLLTTSCPFRFSPNAGLANVKSLRVLDLSQNKLDDVRIKDLFAWIRSQKRLAYLNLRGVADLKELPDWIRKLRNLQLLILTECNNLEKLSPYITTLRKLIVLDIGNCASLQHFPQGLGNLTNLQELSGFKLASPGTDGCRLANLKSLKKLRVLRLHIKEVDEIEEEELKVLSDLPLQVLSIDAKDCEKEQILMQLDQLSPPQSLQELYLRYYNREVTPDWLQPSSLPNLRYLCLENGKLRSMSNSFWGNEGNEWKIEGLCLKYLPRLQVEWETVKQMMPSINYIEVSNCYDLKSFPCEVAYFGSWRKIEEEEDNYENEVVTRPVEGNITESCTM